MMTENERSEFIPKGMERLFEFLNIMSIGEKSVGEAISGEFLRFHRTIQQTAVRVLYHTIQALNRTYEARGDAASFDARNEEAVKYIKALAKIDPEYGFPNI
jgi:hypothetical protein